MLSIASLTGATGKNVFLEAFFRLQVLCLKHVQQLSVSKLSVALSREYRVCRVAGRDFRGNVLPAAATLQLQISIPDV